MEKCNFIQYFLYKALLLMCFIASPALASLQVLGVVGGGAVVNGTSPLVVLDCHYIIPQGEEAGLVVKWYHGRNPRPVYQWIHGSQPQAMGLLRNRLDLRYQPSPDHLKAHSALAFVTPTTELAGEYTCRVATFFEEGSATGKLIVYTPASEFDLKMSRPSNGEVISVCSGRGVFPEPKISLFTIDVITERRTLLPSQLHKEFDVETNLYSVSRESSTFGSDLKGETEFECKLTIPGTDYSVRETIRYYPGVIRQSSSVAGRSAASCARMSKPSGSLPLLLLPLLLLPLPLPLLLLLMSLLRNTTKTKIGCVS